MDDITMGKGKTTVIVDRDETDTRPLSVAEEQRLAQLETVVARGAKTFIEVGCALAEIQERKLYRTDDGRTFRQYCKEIFDFDDKWAYRQIKAAEVIENLAHGRDSEEGFTDILPANERQVRPLIELTPDQQRQVWMVTVQEADGGKVTSSKVEKTVKEYLGKEVAKKARKAKESAESAGMSAELGAALEAVAAIIDKERHGYDKETRKAVGDYLASMRAVVTGAAADDTDATSGHRNANKLEKAGFNLFRMDEASMNIKVRGGGGWPKHSGPYPTKTAMCAAFAELMQDPNNLAG